MSAKYWKLVITSLSPASATAREVVVEGDNWLAALRAARKALGEEGAVPQGASCVMSASGEVTILDAQQRLRYQLGRSEAPAPSAGTRTSGEPSADKSLAGSLPPPTIGAGLPKRATVAYSPEESALARAQLVAARTAPQVAPDADAAPETPAKPAFAPARPISRPPPASAPKPDSQRPDPRRPIPAKRAATVGHANPDNAQTTAPVVALQRPGEERAAAPVAQDSTVREPAKATATSNAAAPTPAQHAPTPLDASQASEAALPVKAAPLASPSPIGGRPVRRQTIAYSPEESAAARAQLLASQAAVQTKTSVASSAHDHLVQTETPSMMVVLGYRDEDPSAESPLTYRERSYFWQPPADRVEVERALRSELATLRQSLAQRARGQYVNLAVFDHAFESKPARRPIATLQWKDWRGEPSFAWLADGAAQQWTSPQAGRPVPTSFFPGPAEPGTGRADAATQPAKRSPPTAVPDNQQGKRESTGEQDARLAVAFEAMQDLYFLSTPADGLDFAVKLLGELIPAEAVSGCIYDINTDEFRFVAVTGTGAAERRAAAVRSSVGLFAVAARSGLDSLVIPDIASEPRYDPEQDGRTGLVARNMAFFVLHRADQLFGMLQIINREGDKGFRDGDLAVGTYIANQVTAFLREKRGLRG